VSESATSAHVPSVAAPEPEGLPGSLREVVLAGPGADATVTAASWNPLDVLAGPARVRAALAAAGHPATCRTPLDGAVTTVLVLGLCLYSGEGYASVIGRLWPLLGAFNPAVVMWPAVSAAALSQARGRLPSGVLREVFQAGVAAVCPGAGAPVGSTVFGLVTTAVDGTVFDLAATDPVRERFATPSGASPRPGWSPWPSAEPAGCWPRGSTRAGSVSSGCGTAW
jgi:Insertion element 4 transposase N-terminal